MSIRSLVCATLLLLVAACGVGGEDGVPDPTSNVVVTLRNIGGFGEWVRFVTVTRHDSDGNPTGSPEASFSGADNAGPLGPGEHLTFPLRGGIYRFHLEWWVGGDDFFDDFDLLFVGGSWNVDVWPAGHDLVAP